MKIHFWQIEAADRHACFILVESAWKWCRWWEGLMGKRWNRQDTQSPVHQNKPWKNWQEGWKGMSLAWTCWSRTGLKTCSHHERNCRGLCRVHAWVMNFTSTVIQGQASKMFYNIFYKVEEVICQFRCIQLMTLIGISCTSPSQEEMQLCILEQIFLDFLLFYLTIKHLLSGF